MGTTKLEGVYPIVATPFRADRAPDVQDMRRLVDFIVGSGIDGVVFPGVASEFDTLDARERNDLVGIVAKAVGARVPRVVRVSARRAHNASRPQPFCSRRCCPEA